MLNVADRTTEEQMRLPVAPRLFIASTSAEKKAELFWTHRFNKYRALKPNELASEVVQVTPELAEWLITYRNCHNRPVRKTRVEAFRAIIESGRWLLLSQGISFRKDGTLNNGQHRLHAIVAAGRAVPVMCVFGESDDAFSAIDTQGTRSAGDCISIEGMPYGKMLAASVRVVSACERGATRSKIELDNAQVMEFIRKNPDISSPQHTSTSAKACAKFKRCSAGGVHAAHYLIKRHSARADEEIALFWEYLITGAPAKSAIHTLRDAFLRGEMTGGRHGGIRVAACIVLAWNAWVRKRSPRKFEWDQTESFPVVE